MKRLVILNPQSRNGRAESLFEQQRADWENCLGSFEVYRTKAPGDATARVRTVLQEGSADQILVAGGDGAINEAVRGFWEGEQLLRSDIPLGIINLGTGGDLFRTVTEASENYREALAVNRFCPVDAPVVRTSSGRAHPFLNIASVGMAGEMLRRMKRSRFRSGAPAYFYHTIRTLSAYQPREVTVILNDPESGETRTIEGPIFNVFVCNGRFSGGGMEWAPGASLDSGRFQVTLVQGTRKAPLVLKSQCVYAGEVEQFPGTEVHEANEVKIRHARHFEWETDGEVVEEGSEAGEELQFHLLPRAFPLVL